LPFGMETAMQMFSDSLHTAYQVIPYLEVPIQLFILSIFTMISLFTIQGVIYVVKLIRG